jgi:ABC-type maltose transport system permease subunit
MAPLLFLDNDEAYTISLKLFSYVGSVASGNPRWNLFAAASVINCVILGILFSLFRKPVSTTPLSEYAD